MNVSFANNSLHRVGQRPDRVICLSGISKKLPQVWLCQGDQKNGMKNAPSMNLLESGMSGNSALTQGETGEKGCIVFGRILAVFDYHHELSLFLPLHWSMSWCQ